MVVFKLTVRTAIHDYNLYKDFAQWQWAKVFPHLAKSAENADRTGTMYLHMQVALCMEVKMHDVCTGLVQASFIHCQFFGAHWHNAYVIGHC